ncbi:Valyl-tRNA synthetase ValS [Helicobacter sp. NHP19-012]|uniref:Valine--tRNA ligase n=1 Tax=Helicobacter gastrofelis TaxID=2849642 RepID=A0ABN6I473_9HELI|nr:valine--tRNA ligase [Helicobacter sp. NHP19-012]BCZ18408.1 Valyl-tRNA synthetase ValS [Helicobacter sp. NHP19-012]
MDFPPFDNALEKRFYQIWQERGHFEVSEDTTKPPFCIIMPPPNVTGRLHMGHALTLSLQDILVRFKRMDGYRVLYQPGLDHAGIATQNVVEKQLLAQGVKKEQLGREAFIKKVWAWKEACGGQILEQMQELGVSCAWSRLRFSMDAGLEKAVRSAFKAWFDKGLIVQDTYMINWCCKDGALADIEVEYKEELGKLYYLRYPLESRGEVVVATTRPETFFGDVALMVHPEDERYKHLIGQNALLPLTHRSIPIIADEYVDPSFGSGCVKVTPAHDPNDYAVGKRHNLTPLVIFNEQGVLNAHAGAFAGLDRLEARPKIVEALKEGDYLKEVQEHPHQVGVCYRCDSPIEPYISKQWFVKQEVAKGSIEKMAQGLAQFYPPHWRNNYNAWMQELRPWCISRQLWWGHQIPVFTCANGHQFVPLETPTHCPTCGDTHLEQDPDVLDTWFSSGLWAFSTLGFAQEGLEGFEGVKFNLDDLKDFYPNSVLITGFDILFFWVARMLLSGESLLGKLPFKHIYLHALVRDENGEKMSKSKGNVIDPLELIKTYGSDSVRFALAMLCVQGRDLCLNPKVLEQAKHFSHKLYNAALFLSTQPATKTTGFNTSLGAYAKSRLNAATKEVRYALELYRFNDATTALYRFFWGEFCDWVLEFSKAFKHSQQTPLVFGELIEVFKEGLKLLHPFMPFLSEYLHQSLDQQSLENAPSIMISPYPKDSTQDEGLEARFNLMKESITALRRLKILLNAPIESASIESATALEVEDLQCISKLSKIPSISVTQSKPPKSLSDTGELGVVHVSLEGVDVSALVGRLKAQLEKLKKEQAKLNLDNQQFLAKAPKALLESLQERNKTILEKQAQVQKELLMLEG